MLAAILRYPRRERRAVAQDWARRSHVAQAGRRMESGPDADTLRRRALHDARGQVIREGVTYHGNGRVTPWCVRRSITGRVDQFDIVLAGVVSRTGGPRFVRRALGRSYL
jgi:hypothetical protein